MTFDVVIRGGTVYDGTGAPGIVTDVAIAGDTLARIGPVDEVEAESAGTVVDATGMAVAPGFVNMLSHSSVSILNDPRSMSELKQGVTTQLLGEGMSMGPVTDEDRPRFAEAFGGEIPWQSLREYLLYCESEGASQNICSLIGATTMRVIGAGNEDRPMTDAELDKVKGIVRDEMADGAMGIGSALIYPPGFYAPTSELLELCRVASRFGGIYFSHLRSEGDQWEQGIDEFLQIARDAEIRAEVWHIKAAGKQNWHKMDPALDRLEAAQGISADMYPYTAGGTGLAACLPPRYAMGGDEAVLSRLSDPATRKEIAQAMATEVGAGWENLYLASGPEGIMMVAAIARDKSDESSSAAAASASGKTIAGYALEVGRDPLDVTLDLIERCHVGCMYFMIDETNVAKAAARAWISVGSDAASQAVPSNGGSATHPRGYGAFARFLGHYCRDLGSATLSDGIRRMSSLPASTLGLDRRGKLEPGWFADVIVFDPETFIDKATYEKPHQYAEGMCDVFVNGVHTLKEGEHSGNSGGRALTGPGRSA